MVVSARVIDNETGEPLDGASVVVIDPSGKSTTTGTVADSDGYFQLDSPLMEKTGYMVQISDAGGGYAPVTLIPNEVYENISLTKGGALPQAFVTAKLTRNPVILLIALALIVGIFFIAKSKY